MKEVRSRDPVHWDALGGGGLSGLETGRGHDSNKDSLLDWHFQDERMAWRKDGIPIKHSALKADPNVYEPTEEALPG